jgi:hypothetical protein
VTQIVLGLALALLTTAFVIVVSVRRRDQPRY